MSAAERSGAPLQAFVRIDDEEITNHNQVQHPDHIVILDRTLIAPGMDASLKPGGTIVEPLGGGSGRGFGWG